MGDADGEFGGAVDLSVEEAGELGLAGVHALGGLGEGV